MLRRALVGLFADGRTDSAMAEEAAAAAEVGKALATLGEYADPAPADDEVPEDLPTDRPKKITRELPPEAAP